MTTYKGLFVQRLSDGSIFSVQVIDPNGGETALDLAVYRERGIQPPVGSLPDKEGYQKQSSK